MGPGFESLRGHQFVKTRSCNKNRCEWIYLLTASFFIYDRSCYGTHKESLTLKNEHHRQEKFFSSWQTIKKSVDLWSTSGDLSEWFKVRCWKRRVVHATMSSNLIVSARWKAPLHDSGFLYAFARSHWQQSLSMLFFQRFPSSKEVSMRTKQLNSSLVYWKWLI